MELKHSKLGPSGASRWLYCTASPQMEAKYPDEESWYAAQGTAAHIISEWCRDQDRSAKSFLGVDVIFPKQQSEEMWEFVCDQEMVDAVHQFVTFVNGLPHQHAFIEQLMWYDDWVPNGFGTVDDLRIDEEGRVAYVTDFKYGSGVEVHAKDNEQLMLYGLAAVATYGLVYDFDSVSMHIVQPRLNGVSDEFVMTVDELLKWADTFVAPRAAQAHDPQAGTFGPGEKACRFCRARHRCRARAAWTMNLTDAEYPVLSNNEIAMLLPHISEMRRFLENVEAVAMSEVQKGNRVGDWKLVRGRRGKRVWRDKKLALRRLMSRAKVGGRLSKDAALRAEPITPAQAEKLLGKSHPILMSDTLITQSEGKPVLVPGDDPRPALGIVGAEEFDNVEEG